MQLSFDNLQVPITHETRKESYLSLDENKRYGQILEIMQDMDKPMTAKEIAVEMKARGYSPTDERNMSQPRLNELVKKEIVKVIGKKKCQYTGKMVAKYKLLEN